MHSLCDIGPLETELEASEMWGHVVEAVGEVHSER